MLNNGNKLGEKITKGIVTLAALVGTQEALGQTLKVYEPDSAAIQNAPSQWIVPPINMGVANVLFGDIPDAVGVSEISTDSLNDLSHGPINNLGNGNFSVTISRNKDKVSGKYAVMDIDRAGSGPAYLTIQFSGDGTKIEHMYRSSLDGSGADSRNLDNLAKPEAIQVDTMPCTYTVNGFGRTIPITNRTGTGSGTTISILSPLQDIIDNGDSIFVPFEGNEIYLGQPIEISFINNGPTVSYDSVCTTTLTEPIESSDLLTSNNIVTPGAISDNFMTVNLPNRSNDGTPVSYEFSDGQGHIVSHTCSTPDPEAANLPRGTDSVSRTYRVMNGDCDILGIGSFTVPSIGDTSTTTGGEKPEIDQTAKLSVYPNPNNTSTLHIQGLDQKKGPYNYKIYNMQGERVSSGSLYPGSNTIDINGSNVMDGNSIPLTGLTQGMYIAYIQGRGGVSGNIKFTVQQ